MSSQLYTDYILSSNPVESVNILTRKLKGGRPKRSRGFGYTPAVSWKAWWAFGVGPSTSAVALALVMLVTPVGASVPWRSLHVPGDGEAMSAVDCFTPVRCVGLSIGSSQVSTTDDGGRTWRAHQGPFFARLGFTSLTCDRAGRCVATATLGESLPSGALVAASSDGGLRWRELLVRRTPGNQRFRFNDVSCSTRAHCLVAGTDGSRGFILETSDAGHMWQSARLPAQPAQGSITAVACLNTRECLATQAARAELYRSLDAGRTWTALGVPPQFAGVARVKGVLTGLTALSCGSPNFCVAGGYIAHTQLLGTTEPFKWVTNDAGRSWRFDQPFAMTGARSPAAISTGAISCVSQTVCTLGVSYGDVYETTDAGTTWVRDRGAPALDSNVLSMTCPSLSRCVASVISNFPSHQLLQGSIWVRF